MDESSGESGLESIVRPHGGHDASTLPLSSLRTRTRTLALATATNQLPNSRFQQQQQ